MPQHRESAACERRCRSAGLASVLLLRERSPPTTATCRAVRQRRCFRVLPLSAFLLLQSHLSLILHKAVR